MAVATSAQSFHHAQDILRHLLALAQAEDKGVRLRVCQLLQSIVNNQVGHQHCVSIACAPSRTRLQWI